MKVGKPKSKRVPVRLRHKIEKASTAKQKKQRKDAKKNPQWRSRIKKDPGIPNLFPYKAKLLAEVEETKRRKEEETVRRREIAKAQRLGLAIDDGAVKAATSREEDEDVLLDLDEDEDHAGVDAMEEDDDSNPMAALLASAQARAQAYAHDDDVEDDDEDEDEDEDDEGWAGLGDSNAAPATRNALPKQALADPIKAVSALLDRMRQTTDGIQRLIEHYQTPPLATATTDMTSSFLVEVARKRGRLGRGGVPNLHSAALVVLGDLNEERLELPSATTVESVAVRSSGKGEVKVVSKMAEPFRIAGLFNDAPIDGGVAVQEETVVEA